MKTFYIPEDIPEEFCYIVPYADYYELYNTNILTEGQNVTFYRFYYNLEKDLYTTHNETITNNLSLNTIQVVPSHSLLVRDDIASIFFTSSVIFLFIIILINIVTSMVKRGGVFSGLL